MLASPGQGVSVKEAWTMNRPSPWRVRVSGPLQAYVEGFRANLFELGYSQRSCTEHLQRMAHLSDWLAENDLALGELVVPQVERFVTARRQSSWVNRNLTLKAVQVLLDYLRGIGVVPAAGPAAPRAGRGLVIEQFVEYLVTERGLAESTIANHRKAAARFLDECRWEPGALAEISGESVNSFLLGRATGSCSRSLNTTAIGLRALLRFLHSRHYISAPLADAVPGAASWRDRGVVRAVAVDEVAAMLAGCDRRTATGRRDFAILTVLTRLGLRRGEVAALSVDDIHWRTAVLVVTGKGNRREELPLPVDVGEAIADYCRNGRRNAGSCRTLFLSCVAPWNGLSPSAISQVVARACRRVDLKVIGAHRLRHTAATSMRAAGAPLLEIGQVLRHRHAATTALYAKDDLAALRVVTRTWPGGRR
jgi:integrase/recombinase XerD